LPVDDDELGVHHAEWEKEETLDVKLDPSGLEQGRFGQAKLL
jgi:hypothetical protein